MSHEYYSGHAAIADYLRPARERYIPLVELPHELNPYVKKYGIHIDAKLMSALPLGNVKSLPAWHMLEDAGDVSGLELVEASSGNTVLSLGLLARHFGVKSINAIASPEVSDGKLALLRLAGVNVKLIEGPICPDPKDPQGAIAVARHIGNMPGKKNLGQYDNDANPQAHEQITGPQVYEQLNGNIGVFLAGLGTTGTLLGTARFLKKKIPGINVAGVVRMPNNLVPGVRTANGLSEVSFNWNEVLTEPLIEVSEKESYSASLRLIRNGLLVGPSAGFAYAGVLKYLKRREASGDIETLRGTHVVFVCPDTPLPYVADYEKVLDAQLFSPIENVHLRAQKVSSQKSNALSVPVVSTDGLLALYEGDIADTMKVQASDVTLVDVREPDEYQDHHLPDTINVPLAQLPSWLKRWPDNDSRQVVFICQSGNRSQRAAHLAKHMGVNAYNLAGGTTEWSAKSYPRIKYPFCSPA